MLAIGAGFILVGMFIGRPYCRWFCPYGGLLSILSRFSWKNVRITPDKELDCGLCADACPFGAWPARAATNPAPGSWSGIGTAQTAMSWCNWRAEMKLDRWKSIARSWTGIAAGLTAVLASAWLLSVYIHAVRVTPVETALVDDLKEKAKSDTEVQNWTGSTKPS